MFIFAALPLFGYVSLTGPGNVVAQKLIHRVIARSTLTGGVRESGCHIATSDMQSGCLFA